MNVKAFLRQVRTLELLDALGHILVGAALGVAIMSIIFPFWEKL